MWLFPPTTPFLVCPKSPEWKSFLDGRSTFLNERPNRAAHTLAQEQNIKNCWSPVPRPTACAANSLTPAWGTEYPHLLYKSLESSASGTGHLTSPHAPIGLPENRGESLLRTSLDQEAECPGATGDPPESPWLCHLSLACDTETSAHVPLAGQSQGRKINQCTLSPRQSAFEADLLLGSFHSLYLFTLETL